jgi:ribosomal subunit interface protein
METNMVMLTGAVNNVRFMAKGLVIDDDAQEYILKRLETLDKVVGKVIQTEVEVDLDKKGKFRVEVMVKTPRNLFRAEEVTESIEGSIDLVVDHLQEQIVDEKEKFRTLRERGARSIKKKTVIDENARF